MEPAVEGIIAAALGTTAPAVLTREQLESLAALKLASIAASLSSKDRPGPSQLLRRAESWRVPIDWVVKIRSAYLEAQAAKLESRAAELRQLLPLSRVELDFVCREAYIIELEQSAAAMRRQGGLIAKLSAGDENAAPGELTQAMIAQARAVPFEDVLGEQLNKKFCCPMHSENTPSAMLRQSRAGVTKLHCYGSCKGAEPNNGTWDIIAFVMQREELSFPDAVRWLLDGKYR